MFFVLGATHVSNLPTIQSQQVYQHSAPHALVHLVHKSVLRVLENQILRLSWSVWLSKLLKKAVNGEKQGLVGVITSYK